MPWLKQPEKKDEDFFSLIYKAAKIEDPEKAKKELSSILSRNPCIDIQNSQSFTPAAMLAAEGNEQAAEFLRKNGASVSRIARGAASGGHYPYAEKLYNEQGASADDLAWGAAFRGDFKYAEKLRQDLGASIYSVATAAAQGGYPDYAEMLVKEDFPCAGPEISLPVWDKHCFLLRAVARSAGQGGHHEHQYAKFLRVKYLSLVVLEDIAFGAALGGHFVYAESLRPALTYSYNSIGKGAAQGGHIAYTNMLYDHEKNRDPRLYKPRLEVFKQAAAQGGHFAYAKKLHRQSFSNQFLLSKSTLNEMAETAASLGDLIFAEELYAKHAVSLEKIASGIAKSGFFDDERRALHALAFIQDNSFRTALVRALQQKGIQLSEKFVKQANKINSFMKKGMKYHQALFCINNPEVLGLFSLQTYLLKGEFADPKVLAVICSKVGLDLTDGMEILKVASREKEAGRQEHKAKKHLEKIKAEIINKGTWHAFFRRWTVKTPLGSAQAVQALINKAEQGKITYLKAQQEIASLLQKKRYTRTADTSQFYNSLLDIINEIKQEKRGAEKEAFVSPRKKS